ncbi:transposase family protein [Bacteroides sp.]|uniref:transposase family protein n=1 Tax=Bacteroides sp. TaxID=29523 RepID=UPI002619B7CA|nr:transposase family protein [Bacteroides sp.]MDD3039396.1 transposase family protein [Bacteroides sp.]
MLNHSFEHKYSTKDLRYRFPLKENSTDASISLSSFYTDSRFEIRDVIIEPDFIHLLVRCYNDHGVCPYCGAVSHKVHSRYCRAIVDLSILEKNVTIHMESRKFFCPNEECKKKHLQNNSAAKYSATGEEQGGAKYLSPNTGYTAPPTKLKLL